MEYQETFKFLTLQVKRRKNSEELSEDERSYLVLNLLDCDNNPCSFFIFNRELKDKLLERRYIGLEDIEITFRVSFNKYTWVVILLDVN